MKRLFTFILILLTVLTMSMPASAATDDELVDVILSNTVLSVKLENIQIKRKLELNDQLTVFSYSLVNGGFGYHTGILSERMGKYLYIHGAPDTLYLYDKNAKTKMTDIYDAYLEGFITDEQLDLIATAYPAKTVRVHEYTCGLFSVAYQYEEEFKDQFSVTDNQKIDYCELYHHKNDEEDEDWVLAVDQYRLRGINDNNAIKYGDSIIPYFTDDDNVKGSTPYVIYDVKNEKFSNISEIINDMDKYDELVQVLKDLQISRQIGDSDYDGLLTISDATFIQMYLAEFVDNTSINALVSDMDEDGDVTILDATAIQRNLAGL